MTVLKNPRMRKNYLLGSWYFRNPADCNLKDLSSAMFDRIPFFLSTRFGAIKKSKSDIQKVESLFQHLYLGRRGSSHYLKFSVWEK